MAYPGKAWLRGSVAFQIPTLLPYHPCCASLIEANHRFPLPYSDSIGQKDTKVFFFSSWSSKQASLV